jgi:hypothetical protein
MSARRRHDRREASESKSVEEVFMFAPEKRR